MSWGNRRPEDSTELVFQLCYPKLVSALEGELYKLRKSTPGAYCRGTTNQITWNMPKNEADKAQKFMFDTVEVVSDRLYGPDRPGWTWRACFQSPQKRVWKLEPKSRVKPPPQDIIEIVFKLNKPLVLKFKPMLYNMRQEIPSAVCGTNSTEIKLKVPSNKVDEAQRFMFKTLEEVCPQWEALAWSFKENSPESRVWRLLTPSFEPTPTSQTTQVPQAPQVEQQQAVGAEQVVSKLQAPVSFTRATYRLLIKHPAEVSSFLCYSLRVASR